VAIPGSIRIAEVLYDTARHDLFLRFLGLLVVIMSKAFLQRIVV